MKRKKYERNRKLIQGNVNQIPKLKTLRRKSMSIDITKSNPDIPVWINDLYVPLYNFWVQLRDNGEEFSERVEEEKQKAIQRIKDEIPTREDIIAMLTSYACEPKAQEIMKGVYEKTDNLLGKLETMSTNAEQTVSKIKAEIDKVSGEVLPYIATVFDIMNGVMLVAKELVRASPAALAASSGPSANGLVIKKTGDGMTMAKVKVKEYSATIAAIKKYTEIVLMVCLEIIGLVASMLLLITRLKTMIVYVRDMLLFYYLKYLSLSNSSIIS